MEDIFKIFFITGRINSLILENKRLKKHGRSQDWKNDTCFVKTFQQSLQQFIQLSFQPISNPLIKTNFLNTTWVIKSFQGTRLTNQYIAFFLISNKDLICDHNKGRLTFLAVRKKFYNFTNQILYKGFLQQNKVPIIYSKSFLNISEIFHFIFVKMYENIEKGLNQNYDLKIFNFIFFRIHKCKLKNKNCKYLLLQKNEKFNSKKIFSVHSSIKEFIKKDFIFKSKKLRIILFGLDIKIDACDEENNTILHILAKHTNTDTSTIRIVELLLNKKIININAQNKAGMTPLHYAVKYPHKKRKLIELFIKYKADVNIYDFFEHKTPLHFICQQKCHAIEETKQIINILISAGADINAHDIYGKTPVYIACNSDAEILNEILNLGADINVEYEDDKNILDYLKDCRLNYKSYNIIRNHLLKLTLAGIPIDEKLENSFRIIEPIETTYLKQVYVDQSHSYFVADPFLNDCDKELNKMKAVYINSNTSLYDILFQDIYKMSSLVKNDNFINFLKTDNFNSEFSNYGFLLKLKFKEGLRRISLINSAKEKLIALININLPDLCLENIFKYLDNKELKSLAEIKMIKN